MKYKLFQRTNQNKNSKGDIMKSSILFLVKHENTIFNAYIRNEEKPGATWKSLEKEFPELSQTMTFNTFKQYISVFSAVRSELYKVRQKSELEELKKLKSDKKKLITGLDNAEKRLDKVRKEKVGIAEQLNKTMQENSHLESKIKNLKEELDKVRQDNCVVDSERTKSEIKPKNVMGWNVQQSKDGYYRCYRKKNKRVHSINIGKV